MHDAAPVPALTADAPAPKGLKTAGLVAAAIAVGVVGFGIVSRHHDVASAAVWSDVNAIPTVRLTPVEAGAATATLDLPATLAAWNAAHLFARVPGYVHHWSEDIGARVSAGQPLGVIDTPELDEQIGQARAALASAIAHQRLARSTAVRWNDLLGSNSVSKQEADEKNGDFAVKTADVAQARAALARLEAEKRYAVVRAPFAGVVTQRNAEIGDLVGPGSATQTPMFAIADTGRIRVYVSVPQSLSTAIRPGETAALTVPSLPGRTFAATVVGASDAVDPQTGAFRVQLVAANPAGALKPGGYASAKFDLPAQSGAVRVPSSAILFRGSGAQVATVDATGHVQLHAVRIGQDDGPTVQIFSGATAGMRVVDNPPDSLAQGELVRIGGRA